MIANDQLQRLSGLFRRVPGEWWITGKTLMIWLTKQDLVFNDNDPQISLSCSKSEFESFCYGRGIVVDDNNVISLGDGLNIKLEFNICIDINIAANSEEVEWHKKNRRKDITDSGLWSRHVDQCSPYKIQLPYRYGTLLDKMVPLWWVGCEHSDYTPKNVWFTPERKRNGYELLAKMLECGERSGIRELMWLGFGNLLGYVMFGDFCKHDTDMDMCILADKAKPESINSYIDEIQKPFKINGKLYQHGLCEKNFRKCNYRNDNNTPSWVSIGHRSIENENGVKSCNWFMFEYSNFYWHAKGDMWVNTRKINIQTSNSDKAVCLGQPSFTLNDMVDIDFHGVNVKMPKLAGTCCDWWYPGWTPEGEGSSSKKAILVIGDWKHKESWRLHYGK